MEKNKIKGIIFVTIGAASYGVLATIIKLANTKGMGTAGLTFVQYLFGLLVLSLISAFLSRNVKEPILKKSDLKYPKLRLMLFGTSLGLTSSFYYLSIQYVPISVGIILLMQTVWLGILLEYFVDRSQFTTRKLIGGGIVIFGTLLASRIFESDFNFSFIGYLYGFLAAICYTVGLYSTNKVSLELSNIIRSKYLVLGGFIAILLFWNIQIIQDLNTLELLKWGMVLGVFGTVLPPVLFNKGVPEIGTGLSSILAALEIPISIFSAYLLLNERINFLQTVGIFIILITVVLLNVKRKKLAS